MLFRSTQAHSWIWGTPTYKSWLHMNGRTFLVEEVLVEAIADELSQLPVPQTSLAKPNPPLNVVSTKRLLPEVQAGTDAVSPAVPGAVKVVADTTAPIVPPAADAINATAAPVAQGVADTAQAAVAPLAPEDNK